MTKEKSYVISVSIGTGCYRHIRVPGDDTLFDLHSEILDAFGFVDDHAHAFFMDNKIWSQTDAYYSDMIEDENRYTCDYSLSNLALQAGKKFKYVFDFGEEWVFQCKVLHVLDEPCDEYDIVCSKGKNPEQYSQEDEFDDWSDSDDADFPEVYSSDSDEADFPEVYSPAKLKKLYTKLTLSKEMTEMLHTYFDAMARLYGVIPLRKALEIINSQNDEPVSEKDFTDFAEIVRHEEHFYCILGKDELYEDGTPSAPLDRELVEESLYAVDLNYYAETIGAQQGKPYYIPPKQELLKYADDDYFEPTRQSRALRDYLRHQKGMTKAQAEEFVQELQVFASMGENDFQHIINDMIRMGMKLECEDDVQDFARLYTDLSNHSRMAMNRGHTPVEIRAELPPENRIPKSISFGPNITAALQNGTMDIDELRQEIMQMDVPGDDLHKSMLNELGRIQSSAASAAATAKKNKKIGRNAPCPCGSGKKYKNCCGRNQ